MPQPVTNLSGSKNVYFYSREEGYRKDDDIDRFMRLFIVVPRDGSEDEDTLRKYFQDFGDVESVNILRNRETHESKGFAYVKFTK